jgi:hypothetical protein
MEVVSMVAQYTATPTRSAAGLAGRIILTLAGAGGLIVGALLDWWDGVVGTDLTDKVLYQTTFGTTDQFVRSIGAVSIALGVVAVIGLAGSSGWLTRLAGALGVVMIILFAIQGYRVTSSATTEFDRVDVGAWIALAGGVVALVGGFLGRPRLVAAPVTVRDEEV